MRISCFFLLQPFKNTINCGLPSHALNIKSASETAFTTCCCPTADSPLLQHISKDQSTFPSQSGKGLSLESQSNGSELLQCFWFQRFQLASYYHLSSSWAIADSAFWTSSYIRKQLYPRCYLIMYWGSKCNLESSSSSLCREDRRLTHLPPKVSTA